MSKWKLIEDKTGMKMGSSVLVYAPHYYSLFAGEPIFATEVLSDEGKPYIDTGYEVTHWRPMVKPPKTK